MMKLMMIVIVAASVLGVVAHGWNEDQQMAPVGVPYDQVGDTSLGCGPFSDPKTTLQFASWYTLEDWEMVKGSAASFAVDENGHVTGNKIDPAIGWGE
jgi:hypothetical protein